MQGAQHLLEFDTSRRGGRGRGTRRRGEPPQDKGEEEAPNPNPHSGEYGETFVQDRRCVTQPLAYVVPYLRRHGAPWKIGEARHPFPFTRQRSPVHTRGGILSGSTPGEESPLSLILTFYSLQEEHGQVKSFNRLRSGKKKGNVIRSRGRSSIRTEATRSRCERHAQGRWVRE